MLYLILCYLGITCICLWAGIIFYSLTDQAEKVKKNIFHYLITGLIVVTSISQWIVLVFPLNATALLFILCILFIVTILQRKRISFILIHCVSWIRERNSWLFICFFCFSLMILILNAGPVLMDDTDSYHIQMVKWIQEYGSVPGIANLHLRFGLNSSWFVSIAQFSFPLKGLNIYATLNGLLSVWLCFYFLEIFYFSFGNNKEKSDKIKLACFIIFFLCLLNWTMIRGSATNANYDFISTCCIIVLFIDLYKNKNEVPIEWLIWPAYLFTVRMMNFPLFILSLIYISRFIRTFSLKKLLIILFSGGFIIVPFLIRNIILSGYMFFPVYQLDFFSFDWKADKMRLIEISNYIKYFNRVNPMFQSMSVTQRLHFPEWIPRWYNYLFRFDKLIFTFSFLGYAFLLFSVKKMKNRLLRVFFFVMIFHLICWFFIGPDPRFVYGPLLFGIFTAITCLPVMNISFSDILKYAFIITSFFALIYGVSRVFRDEDYRNFLTPRSLPVPAIRTITVGHVQMYIPEKILNNWNPRCYDIVLPCLYKQDPRLEARGEKIPDGFRLKSQSGYIFTGGEYKITE
jgi:hypothetical protein